MLLLVFFKIFSDNDVLPEPDGPLIIINFMISKKKIKIKLLTSCNSNYRKLFKANIK